MDGPKALFVWLDLETTGLDPKKHQICAIGMRITDEKLNVLCPDFERIVRLDPEATCWGEVAHRMHEKSGLLAKALEPNGVDRWDNVKFQALVYLRNALGFGAPKNTYFAGNSVHFDTAFLREQAPQLLQFCSYRLLDVSAFKVLFSSRGLQLGQKQEPAHMPLADIDWSMKECRYMLSQLFPGELT